MAAIKNIFRNISKSRRHRVLILNPIPTFLCMMNQMGALKIIYNQASLMYNEFSKGPPPKPFSWVLSCTPVTVESKGRFYGGYVSYEVLVTNLAPMPSEKVG